MVTPKSLFKRVGNKSFKSLYLQRIDLLSDLFTYVKIKTTLFGSTQVFDRTQQSLGRLMALKGFALALTKFALTSTPPECQILC